MSVCHSAANQARPANVCERCNPELPDPRDPRLLAAAGGTRLDHINGLRNGSIGFQISQTSGSAAVIFLSSLRCLPYLQLLMTSSL